MNAKKIYILTDDAPRELRRQANGRGEIAMTENAARYELSRGTLRLPASAATKSKSDSKSPATPVLANGGA